MTSGFAFAASALMSAPSRARMLDMRYRVEASPIERLEPTHSICVSPADSSFATSESMALLVAVHARIRAPFGTRERHTAVMNVDLPVPGGPWTSVTGPSRPLMAARWLGLRRRSWACTSGSLSSMGRHGDGASSTAAGRPTEMPRPAAIAGSSFATEHSECTRWSAVLADANSINEPRPLGSMRGARTICLSRNASASIAIARNWSRWAGLRHDT
mmetsp:Transcript_11175/g.22583  ORF Transcript_11175/g.22583 Transcript_11175/m.22583 type:complete len:216 (+) Transcript_11175:1420-2067(+)